jgi:N6-adenosine-specific RNA methylase IME4/ParB-like chromosome segregation protein Spo0J
MSAATTFRVHPAAELFPLLSDVELRDLAEDIREHGQQLPIITWRGVVVDGRNRLRACELIGVEPVMEPRLFADDADVARFVVSANLKRRHLNEGQRAMIGARLEPFYAEEAKQRQAHGTTAPGKTLVANLPEASRARDDAARDVNVSPRSVQAAKTVLEHGSPELVRATDEGRVAVSTAAVIAEAPASEQAEIVARGEREIVAAAKEIRNRKLAKLRAERIEKIAGISEGNKPLPFGIGPWPVLYADPPWRYEHVETESRAIENQYPTMSLDEICALGVSKIATEDAILFLWATSPKLAEAMRVIEAWGFVYRTCMVWDKEALGMGYYARQQHELLLIATRGNIPTPKPEDRPASVVRERRPAEHSRKPARFAELIERMYPELQKVELFCRSPRDGWAAWGNQS